MTEVHIDVDILTDLKEVMDADFNRLVTLFINDVGLRLKQLQELLNVRDLDGLSKAAHSLKGSSSNLGALRLAELLQKMESTAKQGKLQNELLLLQNIRDEYQLVREELTKWI